MDYELDKASGILEERIEQEIQPMVSSG